MKSTISVELDGTMFALDEGAFVALRSYLDRARARLGAHPDRAEVLAGLERSIAAKLVRASSANEAPITAAAMQSALERVGRVDGPSLDDAGAGSANEEGHSPRRLYRLREGQQLAGVCAGLAAFAQVDVGVVRFIFILGALFSGGLLLLIYGLLAVIMPVARAEDESGQAHGDSRRSS